MAFQIALPLIHSYSFTTQLFILSSLLAISYLHKTTRLVVAGLTTFYLAFKILAPVVVWLFWAFKGIAWMGFYVHYFLVALGFVATGGTMLIDLFGWFESEVDKIRREQREQRDQDGTE